MIEAAKLLGIQGLTEAGNIDGLEAKKENTAWKPESEGTRFNHNSIGSTVTNGQLLKEEVEEDEEEAETRCKAAVEMAKPDSSNNLIFPALHQAAPVFSATCRSESCRKQRGLVRRALPAVFVCNFN